MRVHVHHSASFFFRPDGSVGPLWRHRNASTPRTGGVASVTIPTRSTRTLLCFQGQPRADSQQLAFPVARFARRHRTEPACLVIENRISTRPNQHSTHQLSAPIPPQSSTPKPLGGCLVASRRRRTTAHGTCGTYQFPPLTPYPHPPDRKTSQLPRRVRATRRAAKLFSYAPPSAKRQPA